MGGPIAAGQLAMAGPDAVITLPWVLSGVCCIISAILLIPLRNAHAHTRQRTEDQLEPLMCLTAHEDLMTSCCSLTEEEGSVEDYERVGRFVGGLLKERNYRWVSRQDAVLDVINHLLPRL